MIYQGGQNFRLTGFPMSGATMDSRASQAWAKFRLRLTVSSVRGPLMRTTSARYASVIALARQSSIIPGCLRSSSMQISPNIADSGVDGGTGSIHFCSFTYASPSRTRRSRESDRNNGGFARGNRYWTREIVVNHINSLAASTSPLRGCHALLADARPHGSQSPPPASHGEKFGRPAQVGKSFHDRANTLSNPFPQGDSEILSIALAGVSQ